MSDIVKFEEWKERGQCAQGDLFVRVVDNLPIGLRKVEPKNGVYIVAHSESGHHHVVACPGVEFYESDDQMTTYLHVIDATETILEHLRSFDTHRPIQFLKGIFRVRRGRVRTPEGWRLVED